ncbi:hypothetical protein FRB99_004601 [Tulasnella sp. 403]|nr:hypothetical protein FRB99_004601 [Tulasnella sp. 403]
MSNIIPSIVPYVRVGNSGLKVSKVILGCMSYGWPEWQPWVLREEEGMKHIKQAYDLGINTFDTADVYSNGESERILGKAIKKYNLPRDEIVVMTKVGIVVGRERTGVMTHDSAEMEGQRYTNQFGLSRKHIFEGVKHSLERLQLDYVDVLQCHRLNNETPVEETMQALHDVVKAGYARYIGMSSCWAWQFAKMQNYARQHNLTEFISMQNFHNAIYREEEREMVPMLRDMGVGMFPWSPLARGFLTRRLDEDSHRKTNDPFTAFLNGGEKPQEWMVKINEKVAEIAEKRGVSMAQVALAWTLSKPFVTAPVVGTTSVDKLKDLVQGVHLKLTEEEVRAIDEPYKPRPVSGLQPRGRMADTDQRQAPTNQKASKTNKSKETPKDEVHINLDEWVDSNVGPTASLALPPDHTPLPLQNLNPYVNHPPPIIRRCTGRRLCEEIDRIYGCNWEGCPKTFGTLNRLNAHVSMQRHGPKRTPGEFKEMRKAWKRQRAAQKQAEREKTETMVVSRPVPVRARL